MLDSLFPELERFPDANARWQAWRAVRSHAWSPPDWLLRIGGGGVIGVVVILTVMALSGMSKRVFQDIGLLMLGGGTAAYLVVCLVVARSVMRRSLRRLLVDCGIPVCIRCGYDLMGNVSGKCPECGEKA